MFVESAKCQQNSSRKRHIQQRPTQYLVLAFHSYLLNAQAVKLCLSITIRNEKIVRKHGQPSFSINLEFRGWPKPLYIDFVQNGKRR